jgi:DNA polymerase-3 subunit alpha
MRSKLRKAVGKKIKSVMDEVGEAMIAGAPTETRDPVTGEIISPVFSQQTAARLFEYMKGSADYLFNASHSFAYAQLAYVTAFLKANWPAEYGAAILATTSAADKRQAALRALREEGIVILAPNVNTSGAVTRPNLDGEVILGLSEIKGVGTSGFEIAEKRISGGPFTSLRNLLERVKDEKGKSYVDVGSLEGLIEAGATDMWGSRLGLMSVARASKFHVLPTSTEDWGVLERSTRQRARLGVIIGKHPMDVLGDQVWKNLIPGSRDEHGRDLGARAVPLSEIADDDGASTMTAAVLAEWTERAYSKGRMVNVVLESAEKSIRGVMWNETLARLRNKPDGIPTVGSIVSVAARVMVSSMDVEDEEGNVIDTVITHELSISALNRVPVIDTVEKPARVSMPSPLRAYISINRAPAPVPPSQATAEATENPEPEEPDRGVDLGMFTASALAQGILPVVVRDPQRTRSAFFGFHPRGEEIVGRLRRRTGVTHTPSEPRAGTEGLFVAHVDGKPVAYVLWARVSKTEVFPSEWAFDGSVPAMNDILLDMQPQRGDQPTISVDDYVEDEPASQADDWLTDLEFS